MDAETPISRPVLSETVKDRLIQGILDGRYPPGSRIVESRAAYEFGTSQAPVREALRDLEALGLVEISAFRGARVRRPSRDELLEGFVVRAELEVLAIRPLAAEMTPADLDRLQALLDDMRRAADAGDLISDALADAAFHTYLVKRAGNRTLERVWRMLEPHSRTYITITAPGSDRHAIAELHAPILEALRTGDPTAAETAIRSHFDSARAMLSRNWVDSEPVDASSKPQGASRGRRSQARLAAAPPMKGTR